MEESRKTELLAGLRLLTRKKDVLENAPMCRYTSLGLGGPAEVLCEVFSAERLVKILRLARRLDVPVLVIGNGTNLLVRDGGLPGLTLRLGEGFSVVEPPVLRADGRYTFAAQAGATLVKVSNAAAEAALTGLEFAAGIPGTVGGGVVMNAGAYGGEMKDVVRSVTCTTLLGEIRRYTCEEMHFSYRHSRLNEPDGETEIVLDVTFALAAGDGDAIRAAMREYAARRREKQPLTLPSCGSTFKRPPGQFAGTLIEQCGLKGLRVGGVSVSTLHAGFLVNDGNGTAADYLTLMAEVQRIVLEKTGVALEPEVRVVGEELGAA